MQFLWIGFLKAGSDADQEVLQQETAFLQQPYVRIVSTGALRDEAGRRTGMVLVFDADDWAAAQALVAESPFRAAGLYEHYHLAEYRDQVG